MEGDPSPPKNDLACIPTAQRCAISSLCSETLLGTKAKSSACAVSLLAMSRAGRCMFVATRVTAKASCFGCLPGSSSVCLSRFDSNRSYSLDGFSPSPAATGHGGGFLSDACVYTAKRCYKIYGIEVAGNGRLPKS